MSNAARRPDDSSEVRASDDRAARAILDAIDEEVETDEGDDEDEASFDLDDEDLDEALDPTPVLEPPRARFSYDAADETSQQGAVLTAIHQFGGSEGLTTEEVEWILRLRHQSASARVNELRDELHQIAIVGKKPNRSGRLADAYLATPSGLERARVLPPILVDDPAAEEPSGAIVEVVPSRYWRCRLCLSEVSVAVSGRAPSVCRGCGQIGSIFMMPEDYEPEPLANAPSRRPSLPQVGLGLGSPFGQRPAPPAPPAGTGPYVQRGRQKQRATIVDPAEVEREPLVRSPTGVPGLDHVTGGGIAQGYVVMVAGPPGCGKSTICTQAGSGLAQLGTHFGAGVAYGAAEEDADAVIETADRVAMANFKIVMATSCQTMIEGLDETDAVVWIVDSLMAITSDDVDAEPGLPSQINACATLLFQRAHAMPGTQFEGMEKRSIYLVAHGTKDGNMAGPLKALHSVDGGVLMEHVDPTGADTKGNVPWAPAKDQTRPTGFVSARVYRKMRKSSNRPISFFLMQPEFLDEACTIRNPVGGRLDRVQGPEAAGAARPQSHPKPQSYSASES